MSLTLAQDSTFDQEPLTTDEARAYLRLASGADESTLKTLIVAARNLAESANGRQVTRKQWKLTLDRWPNSQNLFAYPYSTQYTDPITFQFQVGPSFIQLLDPLVSVDSVVQKTSDGANSTLTVNTDYIVDLLKHPGVICPAFNKTWPFPSQGLWPSSAITITFTSGFLPAEVPLNIKQGMLLLISQMYEQRVPFDDIRTVAELPYSVTALFAHEKIWKF